MKLYTNRLDHLYTMSAKIAANAASVPVEIVLVTPEMAADAGFKAKKEHGSFPFLELEDGSTLGESNAIGQFLARHAGNSDLYGKTAFEEAQIEQW
jgi:glutathione S-transferase